MSITEKSISVLNNLIELNNDRVAGFEKAMADIKDENVDLKAIFQKYSSQSRTFTQELTAIVATNGGDVETGNSVAGTLHRAWIDVKSIFDGGDRASILSEAERGEDAIKAAYSQTLQNAELSGEVLNTVSKQAQDIKAAHDIIKGLRDAAEAMK